MKQILKTGIQATLISMAVFTMLFAAIQNAVLSNETDAMQSEYATLIETAQGKEHIDSANTKPAQSAEGTFDYIATGERVANSLFKKATSGFVISMTDLGDPTSPHLAEEAVPVKENRSSENSENDATATEPFQIRRFSDGMQIDFPVLYSINSDIRGWIKIDNSIINYPVVQTTDNEYYLNHSFNKTETSVGCLFFDYSNDVQNDENIVIYGHNLGRSTSNMFTGLLKYYDYSYWLSHKYIYCDTIYCSGTWEVFAVFKFNIDEISQFNYSQQEFSSDTEYETHIKKMKYLSLYDTGITPENKEKLLTLSTCDREAYGKNGRCVIVCKKIY